MKSPPCLCGPRKTQFRKFSGLGWLLGSMVIGLILDDGGFLVKDRARSKAGIDLGHWETCALGVGLGRSFSLFF